MLRLIKYPAAILAGLLMITPTVFGSEVPGREQLEDLIVTAQKVEEDAMKIPVSVSVFSAKRLEDAGIGNVLEMTRLAPNVYMKKSTSENMITIRGITPFDSSVYSPTAFYVDDVLLPLHYMHNIDFFDLERVEVLKGPQGALYGGNSESGVINVITRQPGNAFAGKVALDTGAYPSIDGDPMMGRARVSLSGPVQKDRFYFGVAGMWEKNQGVTTNLATGEDNASKVDRYNGRVNLRYTPSDVLEVSLIADAMKNKDHIGVYRFETGAWATEPHTIRHEETDWSDEDGNGQALRIKYKTRSLEFISVTGRRGYVNNNQQDYDCTSDPANNWGETVSDYDDMILTQEFRISSIKEAPFTWLAGIYAFKEDTRITQTNAVSMKDNLTDIDNKGYAFFGNGTYTFFNRFHISAGLRYDARFQEGLSRQTYYDHGTGGMGSRNLSKDQDFHEFLPRFSLGIDLTDDFYFYTLVSKGFLAGGYNYSLAVDTSTLTYDPEYVWNYEAGIKASFFQKRLTACLSAFYLKISDKQVYKQTSGASPGTKVDNAANAHTRGIELEIAARPYSGLELNAGLGLIQGEYDDWIATEWNDTYTGYEKNDYSGKDLPNVPEYTFSLGAQYRFLNGFFVRADVNGVGAFYGDHANTVKEDAYALVNLKLGYETETFDIYVWGKNVFDREYHTVKYEWDGMELVQDGEPFCAGLSVVWRF